MKPVRHFIIIGVLLFSCFSAHAIPARRGTIILNQPDGSGFTATLRGDEFCRLLTTSGGNAIIQEDDGYYCYAVYDAEGNRKSTGYRVGKETPAAILATSRNIPYQKIAANAAKLRSLMNDGREPLVKRLGSTLTRSDDTAPAAKHGIVILAQFQDESFNPRHTKASFEALLTSRGYTGPDGKATGCAKDYFDDQFKGKLEFMFDVFGPVTLSHNKAYYGANDDKLAYQMIIEACLAVDGEADFSLYDDDGDGEADNVYVFFAGKDEAQGAEKNCIWSHAWYLKDGAMQNLTLDGTDINRYACSSELRSTGKIGSTFTGIGTFCHEYSHTLGLPDFYDTDKHESGGEANALWYSTSIMDGGGYNNNGDTPPNFNAVEREMLGLVNAIDLTVSGEQHTFSPIGQDETVYRINGNAEGEYYLFECRNTVKWDKYIYTDLYGRTVNTGLGTMLVYHVDRSGNPAGMSDNYGKVLTASERWFYNEVNANPRHECSDLIEAGGPDSKSIDRIFFPQKDAVSLIPQFHSGRYSHLALTGITGNSDGTVTFSTKNSGIPQSPAYEAFQDKVTINWTVHDEYDGDSHIEIGSKKFDVIQGTGGKYCIVVGGLGHNTLYTAKIYFEDKNKVETISFKTGKYREGTYPFIFLKNVSKNNDGSFRKGAKIPLILYNAPGLDEAGISWIADAPTDGSLTWYFNDSPIERGEDGYYTITESGILKAVATYVGDTTDVIVKEITVK